MPQSERPYTVQELAQRWQCAPETIYAQIRRYEVRCLNKSLRMLSPDEFVDEFDRVRETPQLAGKIEKCGSRYFGIAFVDRALALSVRQ